MTSSAPLSSRRVGTSRRNLGDPVSAKNVSVTKEEINALKIQKQNLFEEKKLLNAKIARQTRLNIKSNSKSTPNPALIKQLDTDFHSLSKLIEKQKEEIEQLINSDAAVERQELIEEAKILYQEKLRINDLQKERKRELKAASAMLAAAIESDGPKAIEKQQKKISELEAKLAKYERANEKLLHKIELAKQQKASEQEKFDESVDPRKEQLRQQIKEVQEKTKALEKKLEESIEEHNNTMEEFRSLLKLRGVDVNSV